MSKETRMSVNLQELNTLNDWLTRINYTVNNVELRQGLEPGVGQAITAYVETDNDEGYFKLLTTGEDFSAEARHRALQEAVDRAVVANKEKNV